MKIGIITYHFGHNYGAMLQAFAIQHELLRMGHSPRHVHVRPSFTYISKYNRENIRSIRGIASKIFYLMLKVKLDARFNHFEKFLADHLLITRRYENTDELQENPPEVTAYVFGSDQIWNLQSGIVKLFYGAYAPRNIPLISYAPSFGNSEIPDEYKNEVRDYLVRFQHLSVREECGRKLVADLTGKTVAKVIDPVFLVDDKTWEDLEKKPDIKSPYIAFYSLESSARTAAIVKHLSKTLGMPVVVLGKAGLFAATCRIKLAIDSGPGEFLGWIRHAALVVTNSFHATAFAVKFGVPFVTIAHSHRNARMEDLLSGIGMEDRIVRDVGDLRNKKTAWLLQKQPPTALDSIIAQVASSREYLRSALVE